MNLLRRGVATTLMLAAIAGCGGSQEVVIPETAEPVPPPTKAEPATSVTDTKNK